MNSPKFHHNLSISKLEVFGMDFNLKTSKHLLMTNTNSFI